MSLTVLDSVVDLVKYNSYRATCKMPLSKAIQGEPVFIMIEKANEMTCYITSVEPNETSAIDKNPCQFTIRVHSQEYFTVALVSRRIVRKRGHACIQLKLLNVLA